MKLRLVIFLFLLSSSLTNAAESFSNIDQAVKAIAGENFDLKNYQAAAETKESPTILGIIFREDSEEMYGKLFILKREMNGKYVIVETSHEFRAPHGPHRYIETINTTSRDRFSIQVNQEEHCGIGRDIYRFALIRGQWRVSGFDRSDPDSLSCDVNNDSFHYSANFITGKVITTNFKNGSPTKNETKHVTYPIRLLVDFDPDAINGR